MTGEFRIRFVQPLEDADDYWRERGMVRSMMRRMVGRVLNARHRGLLLHLQASRRWGRRWWMMSVECDCTKMKGRWGTLCILLPGFRRGVRMMAPGAVGYLDTNKQSPIAPIAHDIGLALVNLLDEHIPVEEMMSEYDGMSRQSHIEFDKRIGLSIVRWDRDGSATQDDRMRMVTMRIVRASPAWKRPRKPAMGEGSGVPSLGKRRPIVGKGDPSTEE